LIRAPQPLSFFRFKALRQFLPYLIREIYPSTPPTRQVFLNEGARIMATLDWSQCPAVESIPGKVSGAWVFKDTRMPVSIVFENLEAGATIEEIMEWFDVSREEIVAVIEFAARSLDAPPPSQQFAQTVDAHTV